MSSASNRLRALADLQDAIDFHRAAVVELEPILDAVVAAGREALVEQLDLLRRLTGEAERRDKRVQELATAAGVVIAQPCLRTPARH